jgi:hypothetical protein
MLRTLRDGGGAHRTDVPFVEKISHFYSQCFEAVAYLAAKTRLQVASIETALPLDFSLFKGANAKYTDSIDASKFSFHPTLQRLLIPYPRSSQSYSFHPSSAFLRCSSSSSECPSSSSRLCNSDRNGDEATRHFHPGAECTVSQHRDSQRYLLVCRPGIACH